MTQKFKGDPTELKMIAVADPIFDETNVALDQFYAEGFDCSAFLLMLYDEGRMPFSDRINRDAFVDFIKEALANFPVTGIFESYLFVLRSIFGEESEIRFYVDDPGKLAIDVEAAVGLEFQFVAREYTSGVGYTFFDMIDSDGNYLILRGVSGIETEYELNLLFSEMIPIGISPTITLGFFEISDWVDDDDFEMTDDDDYGIIFVEGGA